MSTTARSDIGYVYNSQKRHWQCYNSQKRHLPCLQQPEATFAMSTTARSDICNVYNSQKRHLPCLQQPEATFAMYTIDRRAQGLIMHIAKRRDIDHVYQSHKRYRSYLQQKGETGRNGSAGYKWTWLIWVLPSSVRPVNRPRHDNTWTIFTGLLLLLFIFQIVHVTCYIDKQYNYQIRTICGTSTLA